VRSWKLSNSLSTDFCAGALEEALDRHGRPEIFNPGRPLSPRDGLASGGFPPDGGPDEAQDRGIPRPQYRVPMVLDLGATSHIHFGMINDYKDTYPR